MADDWQLVGRAIAERITALNLTKAEVQRRAQVSDKTLTGYMDGQPIRRADKRRGLCEALRWQPDSVDRILAGGIAVEADPGPAEADRLDAIDRRLDVINDALQEVLRRLPAVEPSP